MRVCWNWHTGTFEGRVSDDVRVQAPSLAPILSPLRSIIFMVFVFKTNCLNKQSVFCSPKRVLYLSFSELFNLEF